MPTTSRPTTEQVLPFRIDRAAAADLVDQVTAGLQGAIRSGAFAPGARLPGVRDLARDLGVSTVIANQAVRRLADDGLLVARRKLGIHVAAAHDKIWRGHVLWLMDASPSFYFAARQEALLAALEAANLRTTVLSMPAAGGAELAPTIGAALDSLSLTAVACSQTVPGLAAECARRGLPLVSALDLEPTLAEQTRAALAELAAHCAALGLRRLAVLAPVEAQAQAAVAAFAAQGLTLTSVPRAPTWRGTSQIESFERCGHASMVQLLALGQLPDLLFVADDYAARGALTALLSAGVRLPDMMQFVTWANRGHCPVYHADLTRIEEDPVAVGQLLAAAVLATRGQPAPPPPRSSLIRFIAGQTTRARPAS